MLKNLSVVYSILQGSFLFALTFRDCLIGKINSKLLLALPVFLLSELALLNLTVFNSLTVSIFSAGNSHQSPILGKQQVIGKKEKLHFTAEHANSNSTQCRARANARHSIRVRSLHRHRQGGGVLGNRVRLEGGRRSGKGLGGREGVGVRGCGASRQGTVALRRLLPFKAGEGCFKRTPAVSTPESQRADATASQLRDVWGARQGDGRTNRIKALQGTPL